MAVTALAATVTATATASATPKTSAGAMVAEGFSPTWAINGYLPSTTASSGLSVDPLGRSSLVHDQSLFLRYLPDSTPEWGPYQDGTGTVDLRTVTPDADGGRVVSGFVDGVVRLQGTAGPVTLDSAVEPSFVLRVDDANRVTWHRSFDGHDASDLNILEGNGAGDQVLIGGQYTDEIELDGHTVEADDFGWFVAAFDAATGAVRWLSSVTPTQEAEFATPPFLEGGTDDDSLALAGPIGDSVAVTGGGETETVDCTGAAGDDLTCFVLVDLDLDNGEPVLTKVLTDGEDRVYDVAPTADGYVVTGMRFGYAANPDELEGFAMGLDATATPTWSTELQAFTDSQVAVDSRGDILIADSYTGSAGFGTGADQIQLPARGTLDVGLVELDPGGMPVRATQVGGAGATTVLQEPGLVIGPDDQAFLAFSYEGADVTVGEGNRARVLVGGGGPSAAIASFAPDVSPAASTFHPVAPVRLLDSRTTTGGWNGPLAGPGHRPLTVAGVGGVPADASAVVLNLTVTDVTNQITFLGAYPAGGAPPTVSTINVLGGDTIANHATVAVGEGGAIELWNPIRDGSMHVVADLLGYYTPDETGDWFHPVDPTRLLDSRTPTGGWDAPLVAGAPRELAVAGAAGIPADATSAVVSVTVTDTSDMTYLRVEPTGSPSSSSNIAVDPGETITNLVTTRLGTGGTITLSNNTGSVNVVADVVGYYDDDSATGSVFNPRFPQRVVDSRYLLPGTAWGPGESRAIGLDGLGPTAGHVTGVVANLTATRGTEMSYLTLFPGAPRPDTSSLLFLPEQTIAAAATSGVAPGTTVSIFNQLGTTDVVLDVNGTFTRP